ncbi:ArnT family glycosyltransferase [Mycolicibacterium helvum]|uniref:Glycosyltransferase RgtA/B/C/D-like domain-containing protein n=1 Tax=Mycolicibacterium helvum TaxID=1534349 RepID=A0A7I7T5H1_9MYCO|nr:glycosyltransferase 87 family protein [Mycolicibacterium helvum]BBY63366.1 hypothetical protein MHEL_16090 [Mycolicibacterium helvum]
MGTETLGKRHIFTPTKPVLLSVAVITALVARTAAVLVMGDISPGANLWEYGDQAACALQHGGDLCLFYPQSGSDHSPSAASYPSAYMPPLLSYLWLGLFELFGNGAVARACWLAINIAVALGCVALVFRLSLKLWPSKWAAFAAAMILALYPTFIVVSAVYHQTNWAVLLLLIVTAIAVELPTTQRPWLYGTLGGIACGLAALNRSEMLVIGPLLIALGALWRRNLAAVLKVGLAGGLTTILILAPWTVRNYQHFGEFIPTAQSSGYNLWKGYNTFTNGSGNLSEDVNDAEGQRLLVISRSAPHDDRYETHVQDIYEEAFKTDLTNAPATRLLQLTANKVLLLWGFDWTDREITLRPAYLLPWLVVNSLAVFGFVMAVRRRRSVHKAAASIYAAAFGLLTVAYALTAVHARYRMHIEPFLFILAGIGVEGLWIWLMAKKRGRFGDGSGQVAD